MKKLLIGMLIISSLNLKSGMWDIFWNSEFTLEDLSPRASELATREDDSALGKETNPLTVLCYALSCQWCEDITFAKAYEDEEDHLQYTSSVGGDMADKVRKNHVNKKYGGKND